VDYNNKPRRNFRLRKKRSLKSSRDDEKKGVIPAKKILLFGSLAVMINLADDFRSTTLRHQVSLILRFGQPVGLDQHFSLVLDALALRRRLLAVLLLSAVWRP